jgi:hypothetical protein
MERHALMRRSTTSATTTSPRERRASPARSPSQCDYGHLLPNPRSHARDRPVYGRGCCITLIRQHLRTRRVSRSARGSRRLVLGYGVRRSHLRLWRYRVRLGVVPHHRAVTITRAASTARAPASAVRRPLATPLCAYHRDRRGASLTSGSPSQAPRHTDATRCPASGMAPKTPA